MKKYDYDTLRKNFNWEEIDEEFDWKKNINVAHECCDRHAFSNKTALFWESANGQSKKYTFNELKRLSNKLANFLEHSGIRRGDRVATLLPRIPEVFVSSLAVWKTGAICVPIFTAFGEDSIKYRINDSGAVSLITNSKNKPKVSGIKLKNLIVIDEVQDEIESFSERCNVLKTHDGDIFDILYTSGTTGYPKGGMIHHGGLKWLVAWSKYALGEVGVVFNTADPSWSYGRFSIGLANWVIGKPILVYEGEFDAETWLGLMEKYKVKGVAAVPTAYRMLVSLGDKIKKFDLEIKVFYTAGEPATKELVEAVERLFKVPLYESYGLTEVAMLINNYFGLRNWRIKSGSTGKPLPGFEVKLLGDDGRAVKKGKTGEIAVRSSAKMRAVGYWKREEEWNKRLGDGYFLTGDMAYEDKDGYYWFVGRKDDLIKTSGYRIGPFEVENAIASHPLVSEAAVVAKPDKLRGNIIKAVVVLVDGAEPSDRIETEIKEIVKRKVSNVAYPREIAFTKELPRTESGKIKRGEIRKLFAS
jgi:acetyl-CoA synthetase